MKIPRRCRRGASALAIPLRCRSSCQAISHWGDSVLRHGLASDSAVNCRVGDAVPRAGLRRGLRPSSPAANSPARVRSRHGIHAAHQVMCCRHYLHATRRPDRSRNPRTARRSPNMCAQRRAPGDSSELYAAIGVAFPARISRKSRGSLYRASHASSTWSYLFMKRSPSPSTGSHRRLANPPLIRFRSCGCAGRPGACRMKLNHFHIAQIEPEAQKRHRQTIACLIARWSVITIHSGTGACA